MSPVTEELLNWHVQSNARSRAEGEALGIKKVAKTMISMGLDDKIVSQATGLDLKTVSRLHVSTP